jgi:hypothetical protein
MSVEGKSYTGRWRLDGWDGTHPGTDHFDPSTDQH